MADDLIDTIKDAATEPAAATNDGRSMTARSIPDMIAADQYKKASTALSGSKSGWNALRPARVVPPGSV